MLIWRLVSPVLGSVHRRRPHARQPPSPPHSRLCCRDIASSNASPARPLPRSQSPVQSSPLQRRLVQSSPARAACLAPGGKRDDRGTRPRALHGRLIFAPPSGGRLIEGRARSSREACFPSARPPASTVVCECQPRATRRASSASAPAPLRRAVSHAPSGQLLPVRALTSAISADRSAARSSGYPASLARGGWLRRRKRQTARDVSCGGGEYAAQCSVDVVRLACRQCGRRGDHARESGERPIRSPLAHPLSEVSRRVAFGLQLCARRGVDVGRNIVFWPRVRLPPTQPCARDRRLSPCYRCEIQISPPLPACYWGR